MADEVVEEEVGKPRVVSIDSKHVEAKPEVYKTLTPTQQARVNIQSVRGKILSSVRREANTPRHLERYAESAGERSLGFARAVMAKKRTGLTGYALGESNTFKRPVFVKGKKGKGVARGSLRERYIRSQFIGGRASDRLINASRRRVGPQSEDEYNDNLPQHFGSTEDWRATSNARLFDKFAVQSPIARYGGGLPRFWDKPQSVKKRNDMFVKGVFG